MNVRARLIHFDPFFEKCIIIFIKSILNLEKNIWILKNKFLQKFFEIFLKKIPPPSFLYFFVSPPKGALWCGFP
jgi:hypothetical protein